MYKRIFILSLIFQFICNPSAFSKEKQLNDSNNYEIVKEIFAIMEANVITKDHVDWPSLRADIEEIYSSGTDKPFYESVNKILLVTDTNHSFYLSPGNTEDIGYSTVNCEGGNFEFPGAKPNIGYVKIKSFFRRGLQTKKEFVEDIRSQIERHNHEQLQGWILDLSENYGGNMWPMLAGISPLLNDGIHGYFAYPNGKKSGWSVPDDKRVMSFYGVPGFDTELDKTLPIAVISSGYTASSGEAMLITFKGKAHIRSFGEDSCGLSTSNTTFDLSNGGDLMVTTSTMLDSKSTVYGKQVPVDVQTNTPYLDAIKWIESGSN